MKVALVHDQLQEFGGAERVLVALKKIFPQADVYTSFYNPNTLGVHKKYFKNWNIITSWADKIPLLKKIYSPVRFITPWIWESIDFSKYDLVISSSGSYMSKGVITRPETLHICYLHHQPRYLYNYETGSLHELQKYTIFRIYANLINHSLRLWDYLSSQRPDYFIANSDETKKRVQKFYRRDATVIYPPVSISKTLSPMPYSLHPDYYLSVSRLARAKHFEVLIQAANKMKFNLKIIGSGRDENNLKSIAGPTIEFLGNLADEEVVKLYQNAKAFLFSAVDEEFGIAPVEAMGYGLPVIAYASGGLKETVKMGINGFLFNQLDPSSLLGQIKKLESLAKERYLEMRKNARKESEKYSFENFKKQLVNFINSKMSS
ncbi:hypothetical protein A3C98_02325 [Candidatus Roizmanbacteria bacterium RIFCSPHIGHO2_02_FULL_37_15]|uniref:Glycosyl transferase family 1 domain-containing protein n=1 Tax=Candidatus Roizmanbacteria bacterium RIFCSPLOWO2_01_FULL_37_16 TaxID=1802058 RepID=A0A1F7IJN9_9BACT|nr:MAG: hypothetical protein A2859_01415 [Candidatus Roizmanbacteria bacterium RIFCSPHIGHO2_01_FULL_37_16b]OGK21227.1 MAG: hypothetical protein A3C98_02325 [Candidatus Roizmanbacteria bacterium RIFCSPHIGHO2_02_FULL_37_15]OGK32035.1 MAG: hypothetical protein A3F57_01095 [Candidatus Roizmanbacteria bacterium RIFCSPHIGHO2_12_FULL_36_11]OGK43574.1 MAG: hypothetical protein A3B40_05805 [Candidatus Roizmanbacteria bacterium RIFCSPLOWO2_01_FULL_37_16]